MRPLGALRRRARRCDGCGQRAGLLLHLCGETGLDSGRVVRWYWNLG